MLLKLFYYGLFGHGPMLFIPVDFSAVPLMAVFSAKSRAKTLTQMSWLVTIVSAVSYTHLDVYKRQTCEWVGKEMLVQ